MFSSKVLITFLHLDYVIFKRKKTNTSRNDYVDKYRGYTSNWVGMHVSINHDDDEEQRRGHVEYGLR